MVTLYQLHLDAWPRLHLAGKALLPVLLAAQDGDGTADTPVPELVKRAGLADPRAFRKGVESLTAAGLLCHDRRPNATSQYTLAGGPACMRACASTLPTCGDCSAAQEREARHAGDVPGCTFRLPRGSTGALAGPARAMKFHFA